MTGSRLGCFLVLALGGIFPAASRADVKTEEKSQIKFEGMMGRMMGMFGGKAAKEGLISTVALKGNRKVTFDEASGQIIDLDEEKVYTLDMKKKSYEAVTFAEMRRRMQEAQEKAAQAAKETGKTDEPGQKQMEIDTSLKESGQRRNINGFDCREVILTVTAHEKGKTLDQSGGTVMTSNMWLGPKIASMKELEAFDLRYAQALYGPAAGTTAAAAEQMAAALAMYPAMKDMMGKMQAEKVNMDGTPILTVMTMETVRSAEQMSQEKEQPQEERSGKPSFGGLGGLLGKKIMGQKQQPAPGQAPNRTTFMTMNHELIRVSTDVAASGLAIPAGFKEKK